jgi:hypothetical protein
MNVDEALSDSVLRINAIRAQRQRGTQGLGAAGRGKGLHVGAVFAPAITPQPRRPPTPASVT